MTKAPKGKRNADLADFVLTVNWKECEGHDHKNEATWKNSDHFVPEHNVVVALMDDAWEDAGQTLRERSLVLYHFQYFYFLKHCVT